MTPPTDRTSARLFEGPATWQATAVAIAVALLGASLAGPARAQAQEQVQVQAQAQVPTQVAQLSPQSMAQLDPGSVAQFDTDILRQRGLDPSIGEYFRRAPRFTPGDGVVSVTLNGTALGRKNATFSGIGLLCFNAAFVRAVGLKPITGADGKPVDEGVAGTCLQYTDFSPRTVVTLKPNESAVDIVTPPEFVQPLRASVTEQGGTAGLLNYRAYTLQSSFSGGSTTTFRQLDTTIGFNVNDWIFRSQQSYSAQQSPAGDTSHLRWQSTYGQKTFAEQRQVLQAGRSYTQSPLFGGIAFTGAQWFPERALQPQGSFAVTGLASSRARVEITQNGALLYSTVVPPGPFSLADFPLTNRGTDLQVKVTEENGAQQNFTVPASSLLLAADNTVAEGLSISAGQLWDVSETASLSRAPLVTASQGWNYGDQGQVTGTAGGLISSNYLSGGVGLNTRLWGAGQALYLQALAARDSEHDLQGAQASAALALTPSQDLQFGLSGNLRSKGYRSVQEAKSINVLLGDPGGYNTQVGGTVRWNAGAIGGFTAGLTRQSYFTGDPSYVYSLGWNVSVMKAQFSLGLAHNTARNLPALNANGSNAQQASSSYLYANLIVPLGDNANSTSFVRRANDTGREVTRMGTGVDQKVNDYFGYRATVETVAGQSDAANTNLTAYLLPKYTSVSIGAGQGKNSSSYYAEASGGVILHPEGVAFVPQSVQDTFGVVRLGDVSAGSGVSGVRLDTPQGPVWSGVNGLAGVPALTPYHESRIEVNGKSLPDDVDVDNGLQVVQAGRGAVLRMDMAVTRVRRVLLRVSTPDGADLPEGAPILRGGEFFTASAAGGRVMLTDLQEGRAYSVQLRHGRQCLLKNIRVQDKAQGEQFERGTATCQ